MATALIVDDDPDIRAIVGFCLEDLGVDVREAPHGAAALTALAEAPPDVMVLDLMMPDVDGFSVLEAMRAEGLAPDTRVLILTCRTAERDLVRARQLRADAYLLKPFDPDRLAARVRELLADLPAA